MAIQVPGIEEILSARPATQHCICQTVGDDPDLPCVIPVNHPLGDMTEIGIDPLIAYGIFRCPACGDWWGNWLYRSAERDISDWCRFGPTEPLLPHRTAL